MSAAVEHTTSISTGIDVAVPPQAAYDVFTAGFDRWWNRDHHLLDADLKEVAIEPFVGGRMLERAVDGRECAWGEVLTWDPPHVFAFSWRIDPEFAVPAPDAPHSVVTVTFTPTDTGTRVELVHSGLDAHGDGWQGLRDSVGGESGWPGLLRLYAAVAG